MNQKNNNKNILITVAIVIIIFLAYKFLIPSKKVGSSKSTTVTTQNVTATTSAPLGSNVVSVADVELLRKKLNGVKVDTSLFSEKDFTSLEDFRKTIPSQPVGRSNPFAKTL